VRPNAEDVVVTHTLTWTPAGVARRLVISLAKVFAGVEAAED
jgi:hypothetical protein